MIRNPYFYLFTKAKTVENTCTLLLASSKYMLFLSLYDTIP